VGVVIGVVVSAALSALLQRCAPSVGPVTMSAIVAHESDNHPYAVGDNTARRSYFPGDRIRATELASALLRAGHDIDVGYAQINSGNFRVYGLDVASAFEPCTNVATGSRILRAAYARAAGTYGPGQRALAYALSAYNTGGYFAGAGYARAIYKTAASLRYERPSLPGALADERAPRRAVSFYASPSRRVAR